MPETIHRLAVGGWAASFVGVSLLVACPAAPVRADEPPAGESSPSALAATTSCLACHGSSDWFDEEHLSMVAPFLGAHGLDEETEAPTDVHAAVGISCHDCHGGNPDPELAEDLDAAMDPAWQPNPYVEDLSARQIPDLCGRCHSDLGYMRRFDPSARVDQLAEYRTSNHGRRLLEGRDDVATCASCHGFHDVRAIADPASRMHPKRVAETCGSCHADPQRMAGTTLEDGRPLPTDQLVLWSGSVHAAALLERGDLSAPTCNDCHGNHGATPPGVESISFVCGQCHGREARLFRQGPKQAKYEEHNLFMEGLGPGGCADCHEPPDPAAVRDDIDHLSECASCHGNHGVRRPTLAMLTPLPSTPCAYCHEAPGQPSVGTEPGNRFEDWKAIVLAAADAKGLRGDERFDFLVDRALELPVHTEGEGEDRRLRPEFRRLFEKYRVGRTKESWQGPDGTLHTVEVVQCRDCHAEEPTLADRGTGLATAAAFSSRLHEVASATAGAERLLLRARRGGVATSEGLEQIDHAVDALISMEVLVHRFDPEGPFMEAHAEAMDSARAALEAGNAGLDELKFRRRGLFASLFFVILVAVALWWKIRQLDEVEARTKHESA